MTKDVLGNPNSQILEINSKTGLYVTYSLYRSRGGEELPVAERNRLWIQTVKDNIFVICKTPMAKAITKRTLVGYTGESINAHYFDDLINTMQHKPQ